MAYTSSPQILGTPYSGVPSQSPPNFRYGTASISAISTKSESLGAEYLYTPSGILYKLLQTGSTRSWVSQGTSAGQISSITTSDSVIVYPSSDNINLSQGNGVLTTGSGATATLSMSGSYSGSYTITGSSATPLVVNSTGAGATAGPIVSIFRNKTSSNADVIGEVTYSGTNSTPVQVTYAQQFVTIDSNTAASESASWRLQTKSSGTLTNQIVALNTGCQIRGNNTNTTPPAGYLGEILQSIVASGSAVTLTSTVQANVTSVTLTAGIWDIAAVGIFFGATTKASWTCCISANSAATTGTVAGYSFVEGNYSSIALNNVESAVIPRFRIEVASSTTYYLVVSSTFTVGTETAYGSLTATRVG